MILQDLTPKFLRESAKGLAEPKDLIERAQRPHPSNTQHGARIASHDWVGRRKASQRSVWAGRRPAAIGRNGEQRVFWGGDAARGHAEHRAGLDPDG